MKIEKLSHLERAPQNAKLLMLLRLQSSLPLIDSFPTLKNDLWALVFWTDFTKSGLSNKLNGLLTESGITSRLEAYAYDSANIVFPFIGTIVENFCSLEKKYRHHKCFYQVR